MKATRRLCLIIPVVILFFLPTIDVLGRQDLPDLVIEDVTARQSPLSDDPSQKEIIVYVKNIGRAEAVGHDTVCEYTCPPMPIIGTITNRIFVKERGRISPNDTSRYFHPYVKIACLGPPALVYFECEVDPDDVVIESHEQNNTWRGEVRIH